MNIKQIKEKYTCLDYLGESRVIKRLSGCYLCRAPWREDKHPSLSVTLDGKGWQDHSDGTHGNLIDMVARTIGTNDFGRICAEFDHCPSSFDTSRIITESKEKANAFASFSVHPLHRYELIGYLQERGISPELAQSFGVKEAHYTFRTDRPGYLFALAYPNDNGGYELRSKYRSKKEDPQKPKKEGFQGSKSPKGITTHILSENVSYVIFEGFFDMLSFDTMMKQQGKPQYNYIVLNSVVNVDAAIETLKNVNAQIYLCLDNDKAGTDTTLKIQNSFPEAQDIRHRFLPYKDVNDYHRGTIKIDK